MLAEHACAAVEPVLHLSYWFMGKSRPYLREMSGDPSRTSQTWPWRHRRSVADRQRRLLERITLRYLNIRLSD